MRHGLWAVHFPVSRLFQSKKRKPFPDLHVRKSFLNGAAFAGLFILPDGFRFPFRFQRLHRFKVLLFCRHADNFLFRIPEGRQADAGPMMTTRQNSGITILFLSIPCIPPSDPPARKSRPAAAGRVCEKS